MTAIGKRTAVVPLSMGGGMFTAGDPSTIPDGALRTLRNYLLQPNRYDGRPPLTYEGLSGNVTGLLRWEDLTNHATRILGLTDDQKLHTRNASGGGFTGNVTGLPTGKMSAYANFLGKVYMTFMNSSGVPTGAAVYDGTNISSTPFSSTMTSPNIAAYAERLFMAYVRSTFVNLAVSLNIDYTATSAFGWLKTNVTGRNIGTGSAIIGRMFPTSTAVGGCYMTTIAGYNVATNPAYKAVWLAQLHGVDPTYRVPFTLEWQVTSGPLTTHAYALGELMASGGYLYSCTTAGTSAGAAPAYGATKGGTTADGTVTWTNIGTDVVASREDWVPNASDSGDYTSFYCPVTLPAFTNSILQIGLRFKFFNSIETSLATLAPVDFSFKDGLTDGDPRKKNHGLQITEGDRFFPFFNQESSATATIDEDVVMYSEIDEPSRFLGKNTYPLTEIPGLATATAVVGGRYVVFKRRGMWVFNATGDAFEPILPEGAANVEIGCLGPRAFDVWYGTLFWIGEQGVYAMRIGEEPRELCGVGMREEIMNKATSSWVENQTGNGCNVPLLAIDHAKKLVYVYTQKAKIYVYHIEGDAWSYYDIAGSPEVLAMFFDPNDSTELVSLNNGSTAGLCRLDNSATTGDVIASGATAVNITYDAVFKPLELFAPRYEASLREVGVFHGATAAQTSQTIEVAYSYDRGVTYTTPSGYPATVALTSPRVRLPVIATGPSITIRVRRTGKGGAANWSISKADVTIAAHRGELPYVNAT